MAKLQKLTHLSLSFCPKITDAGLKEVAKLKQLERLSLHDTQITDASLKDLAKLKKLRQLSVTGTKITNAGAAKLQKALPKCWIVGKGL